MILKPSPRTQNEQTDFEYHSLGSAAYSDTRLQDTSASPTKRLLHTTTAALDYKNEQ
jgi:hypothetical protein